MHLYCIFQPTNTEDPFYTGCGSTKNCFGTPSGCIEEKNCIAAVTILVRGERYLFELQARDSKYVAVGLSDDSKMVNFIDNRNIFIHGLLILFFIYLLYDVIIFLIKGIKRFNEHVQFQLT